MFAVTTITKRTTVKIKRGLKILSNGRRCRVGGGHDHPVCRVTGTVALLNRVCVHVEGETRGRRPGRDR